MIRFVKLALLVVIVWYILRDPVGAAGSARDLASWAIHLLSVGADKVGAFVTALTG